MIILILKCCYLLLIHSWLILQNIRISLIINLLNLWSTLHKIFFWYILVITLLFVECLSNNDIILFDFLKFIDLVKLSQLWNLLLPVTSISDLLKWIWHWPLHSHCSDLCWSYYWLHLDVILIVFILVFVLVTLLSVDWLKFVLISSFQFWLLFILMHFGRWVLDLFVYFELVVNCRSLYLDPVAALLVISLKWTY